MLTIPKSDQVAAAAASAIHSGEVERLVEMLKRYPDLARTRIVDERGVARTLLHVAADWPGHFPNGARTVAALIAAGVDVNAGVTGPNLKHAETALHGAASSNDVAAIDALLDGGADIEAPGAIFTGGPAMSDAVVFAQWDAAHRLLERGARTTFWQASGLGLLDRVKELYAEPPTLSGDQITSAFWHACHGGQQQTAEYLLELGADLNWIGYDKKTPLMVARESGNQELIAWLRSQGAIAA